MSESVTTSVFLRPIVSPMWLNRMPPMGRMRNDSANAAIARSVESVGSSDWKNSGPNTRVDIVP